MTDKVAYHHGNLRQALKDAALDSIRDEGVDSLSLRALARKVGVSQAAPYRHFPDKFALCEEIANDGFVQLSRSMQAVMQGNANQPKQALIKGGQAYVGFAQANPETYRLMYRVSKDRHPSDEASCAYDAYFLLESTLEHGMQKGVFSDSAKQATLLSIWSLVHGFAYLVIDGTIDVMDVSAQQQFANLMNVIFKGIEVR